MPPKKQQPMTDKQADNLRKLRDDFTFYAPTMLQIRTKVGELVPFELNYMQQRINAEIERQRALNKPVRIIVLKARQMGCSTLTEGRLFHQTTMHKLTTSMIVAHKDDASTNLFNMSKLFYECMPEELRPMRKASNAKELVFENPTTNAKEKAANPGLRSKIKIETAGAEGVGRSDTLHNVHISELAHWKPKEKVKEIMAGLLQAVPNTPNSMIIVESTANGVGGYFYDMWQLSKEGKNDFVPLFFAWFEHPEYRMPVLDGFMLDPEERELRDLYHLDDEQLVWRRWCIANDCNGDKEIFKQEYPSNDIEAFLSSGRPVFNTAILNAMLQETKATPPNWVGNMTEENGRVKFAPQQKGFLSIWKKPKEGHEYVISADVAEGLAHGDYSSADVIDRKTLEQVAQWHGHIDPDMFGEFELYRLAKFYNLAFIVPEVNNHGLTTVTSLKKKYRRIYRRRTVDKISNKARQEYGFQTTTKTKPLAIDKAAECIRERYVKINCKETVEECLTYVRDDRGATNAQQGRYDDRVMSLAIGLYANYEVPFTEVDDEDVEYEIAFGRTGY
jgi:hypothetical protein